MMQAMLITKVREAVKLESAVSPVSYTHLDEPTNHLDIASVEWLEDFLRAYHGAFLVISHDRYFLDRITDRIFDMENGKLALYRGNYTAFLQQKEENNIALQRKYDNTKREIARLEGVVAQQRQWNLSLIHISKPSREPRCILSFCGSPTLRKEKP